MAWRASIAVLGLRPDLVLHGDGAGDPAIDDDMQDGSTVAIPVGRNRQRRERQIGQ
jgi:hypothetical protein